MVKNKIKDLGSVRENSKKKFTYKIDSDNGRIISVKPTCVKCTKISNITHNSFDVLFIAGSIPKHLKIMGYKELEFNKAIDVSFENGETERVYFEGELIN